MIRRNGIGVFWFLFILLTVETSFGQQDFISVLDEKSREPVAYAHVCFEGLKNGLPKYCTTSIEGKAVNDVKEESKLAISFIGYETFRDTIRPGESPTILLKPTILNMDEVVVTAQYTPERADKSIYKINVINAREIELKAATNMADLLKDEVSMNVTQQGVLGTSLKIQGLSGENVKFLMDGVPMIGRMNGNFDLNQINLNNVDHIEVIEGPMSVIYGSNALAGVVNIITKENNSANLSTIFNTYYESVGTWNFDGSVAMNLDRSSFGVAGGRNFFGGYSPSSDTGRSVIFKPRRQYFADGYYAYTLDKLKIKIGADYFNELLQDKGNLQPPYFEKAFDSYFTTVRYNIRLDVNWQLWKAHFLNIILSYSAYNRIKETFLIDLTTLEEVRTQDPEQQDTTKLRTYMGRLTFAKNKPDKKFNYQLGVDLNYESGLGKRILDDKQAIGDYAAFISVKWDPVKSLSVQPGIRFIYNTNYKAPLIFALSTKWNIIETLALRVSYSKGFRAPSIKELYLYFKDVNHDIHGNPDLKAETSNNVSVNLQYAIEKRKTAWSAEISGFYNAIQNIITLAQVPGATSDLNYTYENLDKYKTIGGQANLTFSLYPPLKITAGLAETGINVEMADGTSTNGFIFSTDISANGSYRFAKPEITIALLYKYTGKKQQPYLNGDSLTLGYINGYNTMDFTITKGFWKNRIRLAAGMKNIFNNQIIPSTGLGGSGHTGDGGEGVAVGYGRTVFVRLTFNFNQYK